jgi:hypothetical protein
MGGARHSWWTYIKHAYRNYFNYGAMAAVVALALFFRNAGVLFLGAGLELLYLYMLSTNPRFHRHVDSLLEADRELRIDELRQRLWPLISAELQESYQQLANLANRLEAEDIQATSKRDPFYTENQRKVAVLLASYLKLAVAVTRYNNYLDSVDEDAINSNVKRLESELDKADEKVQKVKMKNIEVLRNRLDKVDKAKANSEYLFAQMETIEDTMSLVVDQAITLSDPKGMGLQIDNLLMNLKETELIASEMESFTELEEGLADDFHLPRRETE